MADLKYSAAVSKYPVAVTALSDEDGGGYMAMAVDLKGCMADGDTQSEAVDNLQNAILEWIDEAVRLQRRVPAPGEAIARAHKEHKSLIEVLQKQDELLTRQTEAFEKQRAELSRLRQQVLSLSMEGQIDESDPDWSASDPCLVALVASRGNRNNDIPH
jgi:predicted RNase H-like HicB family nuclease